MAAFTWTSTASTDFNLNTNYTPNNTPADTNTLRFPSGASVLTNVNQPGLDSMVIEVVGQYENVIGASGAPLTLGLNAIVRVNAPRCKGMYFACNTGTKINIENCAGQDGFVLSGGTITDVNVRSRATINGGTITNVRAFGQSANLTIGASAVITNLYIQDGAVVNCAMTPTNIYNDGGRLELTNTAPATCTLLETRGNNGVTVYRGQGQTFTMNRVRGGLFDATLSYGTTYTASEWFGGATVYADNGTTGDVFTASPKIFGDVIYTLPEGINVDKQFGAGAGLPGGGGL